MEIPFAEEPQMAIWAAKKLFYRQIQAKTVNETGYLGRNPNTPRVLRE
jgi:hypothetical protein